MRRYVAFVGIALGVAAAWLVVLPSAPVAQPIAFSHAKHRPMACAVCHVGGETAARAGIPQRNLCLECHATAPSVRAAALWEDASQEASIPWKRVTHLPDHVFFSHRRHAGLARLDCASCHADIGQSEAPPGRAPMRLDMNACIDCHRREGASQDCAACHR